VDLPNPAAARAFAFDEPNYQSGVYRDVTRAVLTPHRYAGIEVHRWQFGGRDV
jgi:hypothetical protein